MHAKDNNRHLIQSEIFEGKVKKNLTKYKFYAILFDTQILFHSGVLHKTFFNWINTDVIGKTFNTQLILFSDSRD